MDIHIAQRIVNASADKVSVIVVANYSGDEQQVPRRHRIGIHRA